MMLFLLINFHLEQILILRWVVVWLGPEVVFQLQTQNQDHALAEIRRSKIIFCTIPQLL